MPSLEIWVWWVKDLLWLANLPHTSSTILSYKRKRRMKEIKNNEFTHPMCLSSS